MTASIELFPGQYFDAESGNHYNYFRDYDPKTGRYIEPDPVGIRGLLFGRELYEQRPDFDEILISMILEESEFNYFGGIRSDGGLESGINIYTYTESVGKPPTIGANLFQYGGTLGKLLN